MDWMYYMKENEELRIAARFWNEMRRTRIQQATEDHLENKFCMCKICNVKSDDT